MRVIVGKLHHETPVFSDRIRYAEFNPYWNLTPHIARTETLSHLRKNPGYLAEKHIRLFSSCLYPPHTKWYTFLFVPVDPGSHPAGYN